MPPESLAHIVDREAGKCVRCGLCLPWCPTWEITRDEGDSPRGRILLAQALADGALDAGARLVAHLDGCLSCRACERVCPANVGFGRLIVAARALILEKAPSPRWARTVTASLLASPGFQRMAALLISMAERFGVLHLARRIPAWRALPLAPETGRLRGAPSSGGASPRRSASRVALLPGCAGRAFDRETLEAAQRLLGALGYDTEVRDDLGCCGAIALHAGAVDDARRAMMRNVAALSSGQYAAILPLATACAGTLIEYGIEYGIEHGIEHGTGPGVDTLEHFLAQAEWPARSGFRRLPARALLHEPCSARNVLRDRSSAEALLRRIPGIELLRLPAPLAESCCGGAGAYLLSQPEMALRLRDRVIDAASELHPDWVVTTNTGCAIHLRAGLRAAGLDVPVVHPVTLLARCVE